MVSEATASLPVTVAMAVTAVTVETALVASVATPKAAWGLAAVAVGVWAAVAAEAAAAVVAGARAVALVSAAMAAMASPSTRPLLIMSLSLIMELLSAVTVGMASAASAVSLEPAARPAPVEQAGWALAVPELRLVAASLASRAPLAW